MHNSRVRNNLFNGNLIIIFLKGDKQMEPNELTELQDDAYRNILEKIAN